MLATQHSLGNSLRWMRRWIVLLLISANLMAVFLADTATAARNLQSFLPNAWGQSGVNLFSSDQPSTWMDSVGAAANSPHFSLTTR